MGFQRAGLYANTYNSPMRWHSLCYTPQN